MDKLLRVYDKSGQVLGALPLSELKIDLGDGMLDSVDVQGDNLVFTFNTQAGKAPIRISIEEMFNPSNYYTKEEINEKLGSIPEGETLDEYVKQLVDEASQGSMDDYVEENAASDSDIASLFENG